MAEARAAMGETQQPTSTAAAGMEEIDFDNEVVDGPAVSDEMR
jgi:hypothetical protein